MDRSRLTWQAWVPAVLLGMCALGVALVRPAIPLDETRYLEVFREHLSGSPVLLHLRGVPYPEKPPLLFWLARGLTWLGLPFSLALRLIPGLAAGLTVLFVARVGRRAGLELAGWMQASLLLPMLFAQTLLFDSLLGCAVWAAADAWTRGRDGQAALASSLALLVKGPVAYLFLAPFFWSLASLRPAVASRRRAFAVLGLALVPLAVWAVSAAVVGGPDFARALLWERWAGRVVGSFAHARPVYFYLPVILVGALPTTFLLFRRGSGETAVWKRRTALALAGILLALSLASGKQAHYLVPAAPALALLCAWQVERTRGGTRWLLRGVRLELLLPLLGLGAAALFIDDMDLRISRAGREYLESGGWKPVLFGAMAILAVGVAATFLVRRRVPLLLGVLLVCVGGAMLGLHRVAGRLVYPRDMARALEVDQATPIARLGSSKQGLFELLAQRDRLEKLSDFQQLLSWSAEHPGGLIVVEEKSVPDRLPPSLTLVASDVCHGEAFLLLRVVLN